MRFSLIKCFIYLLLLLLLSLGSLISSSVEAARQLDKPSISSVRQLDESSIEIKWKAAAAAEAAVELTRYRIFFSTDRFNNDNNEWPVQIEQFMPAAAAANNGPPKATNPNNKNHRLFAIIDLANTYDCFNECIRNSLCTLAVHVRKSPSLQKKSQYQQQQQQYECHLKSNQTNLSSLEEIENDDNKLEANNYAKIADYADSRAIVRNLPPNKRYTFRVSVYDNLSEDWSPLSDISDEEIDTNLNVKIEHEKLDDGKVLIKWKQTGAFKNYALSRCTIKVTSVDDADVLNENNQMSTLSKIKLEPDMYDLSGQDFYRVHEESICEDLCFTEPSCIRYVYFNATTKCYILRTLNPLTSVFRSSDASAVYSLRSDVNEYKLESLQPDAEYKIRLEYRTLYGSVGQSNEITINKNELRKAGAEEESDNATMDYDDENADTALRNHEMFKKSMIDYTYLANLFNNQSGKAEFDCVSEGLPLLEVEWRKFPSNELMRNVEVKRDAKRIVNYLIFKQITPDDKGVYLCKLKDKQILVKRVNLLVKTIPSKPRIVNATTSDNGTYVKWELDSDGGSELTLAQFEWSKNFADRNEPVGKKIVSLTLNNKRILTDNETYFERLRLPASSSFIRMQLTNNIGASLKSEPYKLNSNSKQPNPAPLRPTNNDENNKDKKDDRPKSKVCTVWIIALIATILIVIAVLSYVVYQVRFKKQPQPNRYTNTTTTISRRDGGGGGGTGDEERRNFIIN